MGFGSYLLPIPKRVQEIGIVAQLLGALLLHTFLFLAQL